MKPGDLVTVPHAAQFDLYDQVGYWCKTVFVDRGEPRPIMLYLQDSHLNKNPTRESLMSVVLFEGMIVQIHELHLKVVE